MFDFSLADNGLLDTANIRIARDRRNIHCDLQRDIAVRMDTGRHVNVYAHIEILKLGVNQRVNADATDARLERTCGYRDAVTNLERSLLPIDGTDLRVLDQLCIAVGE